VRVAERNSGKMAVQENRPGIVRDAVTGKTKIHDHLHFVLLHLVSVS